MTAILVSLFLTNAFAKEFSNSYLSFSMPDSWKCTQEGVAWICTPKGPTEENDGVIVMASKIASPEDKLENFKVFLAQPKTITTKSGTAITSQVMYTQERVLDGTKWIQSQHLNSEVQNFYTLYIATVKGSLAILVTFSSEKTKYRNFNEIFAQAMRTLKLTGTNQPVFPKNTGRNGLGVFGIISGDHTNPEMMPPDPKKRSKLPFIFIIFGLVVLLVSAALYLRKK